MEHDELKVEFEGIYGAVRQAFAEYDMATARRLLEVPADTPEPTREQAAAMADFMPDIASAEFMEIRTEGEVAGYYAETGTAECEVAVVRFVRGDEGWRLAPAPFTMSSYSTDDFPPGEGRALVEREESLSLKPEGMG